MHFVLIGRIEMSKRLMIAVTAAAMASLAVPGTSQAGGLLGDAGARRGCALTDMITRTGERLIRPVVAELSRMDLRLFSRDRKGH